MPSYDPEKPYDNHNQMNRRGGKSRRRRYTLPPLIRAAGSVWGDDGIDCLFFVASRCDSAAKSQSAEVSGHFDEGACGNPTPPCRLMN